MNIAVVVFSQTGNSATVARTIASTLREKGHDTDVHLLRTTEKLSPGTRTVTFTDTPDISSADVLILGGPVWAFRASPPLRSYAAGLSSLQGKKAALFVTHGLPVFFAGHGRALSVLSRRLRDLGADIVAQEALLCFTKPKAQRMNAVAEKIAASVAG
ncbi:MAG: hypothetical protein GF331_05080 [Chitinivibrionales bacterium]|nr:hypothetical protein [Chitinivibrionales bacterium]